nr:HepT-like ribonuclease domain-containing protein [Halotalea alkalilenta]
MRARDDIRRDEVLFDAALRNLQTLSEATQRLPDDIKTQYPDIPWRQISGFRNVLVHNYLGDIAPQTVQSVIEDHLPPLEVAVSNMLGDSGEPDVR